MRFWLIDAIEEVTPDERLVAVKNVSYSEEYLQDHFPEFPVLPGVFMLEAATQSAAWLLRLTDDFRDTVIALKEAKNIKYADFVGPGKQLRIEVSQIKKEERLATFKVAGVLDGKTSLSGRIVLERYSMAEQMPNGTDIDFRLRHYFRKWQKAILKPEVFEVAS